MFGFRRRKVETFSELVKLHRRDLVLQTYRGLLDREPDPEGFDNWNKYLLDTGRLDEFMRLMLASREFLNSVNARVEAFGEPSQGFPSSPRIGIVSNCQGEVIGRSIQAYLGCRPPKHVMVGNNDLDEITRLVGRVRALESEYDILLIQPVLAGLLRPHVPELIDRFQLFPNLGFAAFQPDLCLCAVYRNSVSTIELSGPLGPYHSSIAFHAWNTGMSAREAVSLFNAQTYEALRFHDYWDAAAQGLYTEGRAADLPLEGLLDQWRTRGCFMHSTTHPKLFVLSDIARALVRRMGFEPLPVDPSDVLHDLFGSSAVWPVYPEIGERLGIAGNYWFKPINAGVSMTAPVRFIALDEFVERSFAAYNSFDRADIHCDRPFSSRYQEVFGKPLGTFIPVSSAAAQAESSPRQHPYSDLPKQQYWRSAVANRVVREVDPVTPRFLFNPQTRFATAGSCFAQNISRALSKRGCNYLISEAAPEVIDRAEALARQYGLYSARYGNLYTARQLLQLLKRATGSFVPAEPAWQRADGRFADPFRPSIEPQGFATVGELEADRTNHLAAVRRMFESLEVFIFTLGLTEAWLSTEDGAVFPIAPGVIAGEFDRARHAFVNFGVAEVVADLEEFVDALAVINPAARVLLTVSPVPLAATYEDRHVLSSTTQSKAVLRASADSVCRSRSQCDYFPAFEIVSGHHTRGSFYATDLRGITRDGVDQVMQLFFKHYIPDAPIPRADAELMAEVGRLNLVVCEEEHLDQTTAR
jgi:hypothetical protein